MVSVGEYSRKLPGISGIAPLHMTHRGRQTKEKRVVSATAANCCFRHLHRDALSNRTSRKNICSARELLNGTLPSLELGDDLADDGKHGDAAVVQLLRSLRLKQSLTSESRDEQNALCKPSQARSHAPSFASPWCTGST